VNIPLVALKKRKTALHSFRSSFHAYLDNADFSNFEIILFLFVGDLMVGCHSILKINITIYFYKWKPQMFSQD